MGLRVLQISRKQQWASFMRISNQKMSSRNFAEQSQKVKFLHENDVVGELWEFFTVS